MKKILIISLLISFSLTIFAQENPSLYLNKNNNGRLQLNQAGASHFAQLALGCLQKEYPNKLNQVLPDKSMLKEPHELHPAFYGCFDWHSSVHGHWMLVRLLRQFPEMPESAEIRKKISENLTAENIKGEIEYLAQASKSWERMYGWAWLLKLAEELHQWKDEDAQIWFKNLLPLTNFFVEKYLTFLPVQTYPVRTGVHPNTAFGLSYAHDFARATGHHELKELIEERARDYFSNDINCPSDYEPSGEDFLSACLEEANLMRRIYSENEFRKWLDKFLPEEKIKNVLSPADVSDRSDPKIVHLDGLNLSRAWCLYGIAPYLEENKKEKLISAANKHLEATVPNIAAEHYEGGHWLASFVVMAMYN